MIFLNLLFQRISNNKEQFKLNKSYYININKLMKNIWKQFIKYLSQRNIKQLFFIFIYSRYDDIKEDLNLNKILNIKSQAFIIEYQFIEALRMSNFFF